ncbi:MAG: hypothetical protein WAO74_00480 [Polaribacter sp.]|uniref:hypothetical protein n=1 Tax=Polaribacter sp. TaxID=1920175 RepID=UPI003BB0F2D2
MSKHLFTEVIFKLFLLLLVVSCGNLKSQNQETSREIKEYLLQKFDELQTFLQNHGSSSMMVIVDGEVIFNWGNASEKHLIHSIRKPLIHSLIGIAVAQKKNNLFLS